MTPRRYQKPAALIELSRAPHGSGHVVIEASAGTGKTFTLEHLALDLLLEGTVAIGELLVVTFTEKATAELRQRLRGRIERIAAGAFEEPPPEVPDDECWILDGERLARLHAARFGFDTAAIATLHGFCQRVLTEHAFDHLRLFQQEQVPEDTAFQAAFHEALRRELPHDPRVAPLLEAWLDRSEPVSALAGILRDARRARGAIRPVLDEPSLTAAVRALPPELELMALAARVKRKKDEVRERTLALAAAAERYRAAPHLGLLLAALDEVEPRRLHAELIDAGCESPAMAALDRLAAASVPLAAALAAVALPQVERRLAARKRDTGEFDFQDMLDLVRDGLAGPRGEALRRALRARFRCALIDEFQDTDDVQWEIFSRLFLDEAGQPDPHRLYLIGDPKQAIYGFRGADVTTYLRARRTVQEGGGRVIALRESFRSTARVVDALNRLLDDRGPARLLDGAIRYLPEAEVRCGRPELRAIDRSDQVAPPVVLLRPSQRGGADGGKIRAAAAKQALGGFIGREIRALLDGSLRVTPDSRGGGEPVGPARRLTAGDIFVLTRSIVEGYEVGRHLRAAGVPYAFFKQDGLFQTDEARDVRDLLAAIAAPEDRALRERAWLTPFFGLEIAELPRCADLPPSDPLHARLHEWKALADRGDLPLVLGRLIEESGVVRRELLLESSERALTNYLHLVEILQVAAARDGATLPELARALSAYIEGRELPSGEDPDVQRLESDRDAVQIMTVHKAKGLEAEVVFLYGGFHRGTRPKTVRACHLPGPDGAQERVAGVGREVGAEIALAAEREDDEEARRLLYVAITRARSRLYLPYFGPPPALPAGAGARSIAGASDGRELGAMAVKPNGAYAPLAQRLEAMFTDPPARAWADFAFEEVPCEGGATRAAAGPPPGLDGWRPPRELLEEPVDSTPWRELARAHAGFVVTSYTQIKRGEGGYQAPSPDPADVNVDGQGVGEAEEEDADELPGGAATGLYLHSLLEEVPLASFSGAPSLGAWSALPEVKEVFERVARRNDRDPHDPRPRTLVHAAFTLPVPVFGERLSGIASARERDAVREMEFVYPIPERAHPALDQPAGRRSDGSRGLLSIQRGFVKGFVDLVFAHRGRYYFVDWKSDTLPSYEGPALAAHVARNYDLQARLYSLAMVKILGVHDRAAFELRFGGYLFCFLRGMARGLGVHFGRPSFDELLGWERAFRDDQRLAAAGEVE